MLLPLKTVSVLFEKCDEETGRRIGDGPCPDSVACEQSKRVLPEQLTAVRYEQLQFTRGPEDSLAPSRVRKTDMESVE
jgi:hypothetical protein